jgi:prepilin-type N-terminal cleavage/methylation domain-containing protein
MLSNEKGLSLLEVLAAVTILAVVIISFSMLITKNYEFSSKEEKRDISVNLARTVIEEIKDPLKSSGATMINSILLYENQAIDIAALRNTVTADTLVSRIFYPSDIDRQFEVRINNKHYDNNILTLTGTNNVNYNFTVNDFFSLVEVEVVNLNLDTNYSLQSYLEKRSE